MDINTNFELSSADLDNEFESYESPFHVTETPVEASKMVAKTRMTAFLRDIIEKAEWTQTEAARRLQVDQSRVSHLMTGKIDMFTIDSLMTMLDLLRVPFSIVNLEDGSVRFEFKAPELA